MVTFYKNKNSGQVFASLDDELLISPTGKKIPNNTALFEEIEGGELTTQQTAVITKTEAKLDDANQHEHNNKQIPYKGCLITNAILEQIKNKQAVLVLMATGWFTVSTPVGCNVKTTVVNALNERFKFSGRKKVKYTIID
jgi:hypothetical protein